MTPCAPVPSVVGVQIDAHDTLRTTLEHLLASTRTGPALEVLLRDYIDYHRVLVAVGGLFLLAFTLLSIGLWRRFFRSRTPGERSWSFERRTYAAFGVLSVAVGLFLAVVVAANVSAVLAPREGFAGLIGELRTPAAGTPRDQLYRAVNAWLQSGTSTVPAVLQGHIDDRLAWQRPKAIITTALLVVLVLVAALLWRTLIRRSRASGGRVRAKDVPLLVGGSGAVVACLLLMLMVMGNTQAAIAPVSLTVFFT